MSFLGFRYATPLVMRSVRVEYVGQSINLRRQIVASDDQRWEFDIVLEPDTFGRNKMAVKLSSHRDKNGLAGTFNVEVPQHLGLTVPAGVISSSAVAAVGAESIMVDKTTGGNEIIEEGLYFTFAGHVKVYKVMEDATLRGSSAARLNFFPPLTKAVGNNAQLDFTPVMKSRYSPNAEEEYRYTDGVLYRARFRVEEALDA